MTYLRNEENKKRMITLLNNCNCDVDYLCDFCQEDPQRQEEREKEILGHLREYRLYCVKDENGRLLDLRDLKDTYL